MKNKIIKPREANKLLKAKLEKIKKKLPTNWRVLFIHDHPTYKGQSAFLGNVMASRSIHEETILLIETWVANLKNKKHGK